MSADFAVCINNFNYADYVVDAVESALAQTAPAKQVVVVDDGSTDDSMARLRRFGSRITLIEQPNGGQASTRNRAYEAVTTDWVIFLDADDLLEPHCIERLTTVVRTGLSKVHWKLALVDRSLRPLGTNPSSRQTLATGDVSERLLGTGWYSTVPMSGNCWSRDLLDLVMPIPVEEFRINADGYLNLAAGLAGPIAAVEEPLTRYRIHGANDFASVHHLRPEGVAARLGAAATMDRWLPKLASTFGRSAEPGTVLGHPDFVLMDLALRRLEGERPSGATLRSAARLVRVAGAGDVARRRARLLQFTGPVVAFAPKSVVQHVIDVAFAGKPIASVPWGGT